MSGNKEKFGLLTYSTENIGDEIQSIAARRFLPKIDYFIDRDDLINFKSANNEKVKLIANGWYMHNPKAWPPSDKIIPLLVAIHVNPHNKEVRKSFLSKKSIEFLQENCPVGARDLETLDFFEKNGIPSYFSACMTLTLQRSSEKRQDYILAVDVSEKIIKHLEKVTKRKIIQLSTYISPNFSVEQRFYLAEYYLNLYQNAYCTITSRLHVALPSLAFQTPVLLIEDMSRNFDPLRFRGLIDFLYHCKEEDFLKDNSLYDVNNPKENKKDYLEYRNELIKRCKEFTGYDNPSKVFNKYNFEAINNELELHSILGRGLASTYQLEQSEIVNKNLLNEKKKLEADIDKMKIEKSKLNQEVQSMKDSRSWKWSAPLRMSNKAVKKFFRRNNVS